MTSDTEYYTRMASSIWIYGCPILFVVGTFGNVLSFIVMGRKRLRDTLFGVYLRCIAVCDTGHLWLGLFVQWGDSAFDFDFSATHSVVCKLREFVFHCFGDVAIWAVCAITLERVYVVLHSNSINNLPVKRAVITIIALALTSAAKNTHMMWTRGLEHAPNQTLGSLCGYHGMPGEGYERYVRPWIVFFVVDFLPVILLLTCNAIIIYKLRRMHVTRPAYRSAINRNIQSDHHVVQATIMCLCISFAFIMLVTPTMILLVGRPYWTKTAEADAKYHAIKAAANFLIYVHHSINFYLYCLSGKRFRDEFVQMIRCRDVGVEGYEDGEPLT